MSAKTKKIVAIVCWIAAIFAWNILLAYHIISINVVIRKVIDAIFPVIGTLIFLWVFGLPQKENNE